MKTHDRWTIMGERASKSISASSRRQFLRRACGLAAGFLTLSRLVAPLFYVRKAAAAEPEAAQEGQAELAQQFIFDTQLHFVQNGFNGRSLLALRRLALISNQYHDAEIPNLQKLKFQNFIKEVFLESDTAVGLLSGTPADNPSHWFLKNDALAGARAMINSVAGSKRLFSQAVFTPGQPGWLAEIDQAIGVHNPDSWKGYTLGDPLRLSKYPWRMDDEKQVYPAYTKFVKSGIRTVYIQKGLLPESDYPPDSDIWRYGTVEDVGPAARDWPQLTFVINNAAMRPLRFASHSDILAFERHGYLPWTTDLAAIPARYGVANVFAQLGSSFATTVLSHPRHCAVLLGTLIKGLGADKILWGTGSIWYGSPQWQIEAFRRFEIPEDLRRRFGFTPLGAPDGPVKRAILGGNAARLYGIKLSAEGGRPASCADQLDVMRTQWKEGTDSYFKWLAAASGG
jgi:uncharacterized protein